MDFEISYLSFFVVQVEGMGENALPIQRNMRIVQ